MADPNELEGEELEPTQALPAGGSGAQSDRASQSKKLSTTQMLPAAQSTEHVFTRDRMLGEFKLLRRLGRGGMAEVFLAEQTSLKRHVAIKVLRKELVADATYLQRFKTEALTAAGLNHPHIVQVYTVGETDGVHYMAQEYVQGQNLREYLVRKGPPEFQFAVHVMKQTAAALQAASGAGIIHRDIKPENIMLTRKGDVKVADFGLAKMNQPGEPVNLTQVGTTMGTPLYMSPEQVNGSSLDQRSDIYSFGVTCYHMLSGSPPFRGETAMSVAVQHLKDEPRPLEELRPDLPPLLCRMVHKMMAKDPARRYSSAASVIKDLKRLTEEHDRPDSRPHSEAEVPVEEPGDTEVNQAPTPVATPAWSRKFAPLIRLADRPPRKQIPAWVITCLLLGGISAGVGFALRPRNPLTAPVAAVPEVEHKPTAAAQYEYALAVDSEAAWKAVIDDYPSDQLYRPQAEIELALFYVRNDRMDDAWKVFQELSTYLEPEWHAAGLAGQMVVESVRQRVVESQKLREQLEPLMKSLKDPRLRDLVGKSEERNRKKLDSQVNPGS